MTPTTGGDGGVVDGVEWHVWPLGRFSWRVYICPVGSIALIGGGNPRTVYGRGRAIRVAHRMARREASYQARRGA